MEGCPGISPSACQNQLLVDDEHGKETVGAFFFMFSLGTYFICVGIKCKLKLSWSEGWEQRLQSPWIDGLWMTARFYSRAKRYGKYWPRESRIFTWQFFNSFLLQWIPIAIFKISYLLCACSQSWHLPVLDSVLRQVEQGKMQQISAMDAMRSLYCHSTCNCAMKHNLNFSESGILWVSLFLEIEIRFLWARPKGL